MIPVAARSLNVATAAAIGLAEALRQVDGWPVAAFETPAGAGFSG